MTRILVVDDDASIRASLGRVLEQCGYDVRTASDGEQALSLARSERIDLVILDIMMPRMNGYMVCMGLRKIRPSIPVIYLSAKGDIVDKTMGFQTGADDYVTKPFEVEELLLRIEAVLRRAEPSIASASDCIELGDLVIRPKNYVIEVNGDPIEMTAKEFELLAYMAAYPGQVFSKRLIREHVWTEEPEGDEGIVAVYVRKIREKIERDPKRPEHLITVWGVGYKLI